MIFLIVKNERYFNKQTISYRETKHLQPHHKTPNKAIEMQKEAKKGKLPQNFKLEER